MRNTLYFYVAYYCERSCVVGFQDVAVCCSLLVVACCCLLLLSPPYCCYCSYYLWRAKFLGCFSLRCMLHFLYKYQNDYQNQPPSSCPEHDHIEKKIQFNQSTLLQHKNINDCCSRRFFFVILLWTRYCKHTQLFLKASYPNCPWLNQPDNRSFSTIWLTTLHIKFCQLSQNSNIIYVTTSSYSVQIRSVY